MERDVRQAGTISLLLKGSTVTEELENMFLNEVSLQKQIEELVQESGMTYIEAIIEFCTENSLDFEDIVSVVSVNLKEKIRVDAMNEGLMPKQAMLPL